MNVGPNMASIRYIEYLKFTNGTTLGLPASSEFPWSYETMQHEHALVTVDDECKIKTWDQYGDNEQQINEGAIAAIMEELKPLELPVFPNLEDLSEAELPEIKIKTQTRFAFDELGRSLQDMVLQQKDPVLAEAEKQTAVQERLEEQLKTINGSIMKLPESVMGGTYS